MSLPNALKNSIILHLVKWILLQIGLASDECCLCVVHGKCYSLGFNAVDFSV